METDIINSSSSRISRLPDNCTNTAFASSAELERHGLLQETITTDSCIIRNNPNTKRGAGKKNDSTSIWASAAEIENNKKGRGEDQAPPEERTPSPRTFASSGRPPPPRERWRRRRPPPPSGHRPGNPRTNNRPRREGRELQHRQENQLHLHHQEGEIGGHGHQEHHKGTGVNQQPQTDQEMKEEAEKGIAYSLVPTVQKDRITTITCMMSAVQSR